MGYGFLVVNKQPAPEAIPRVLRIKGTAPGTGWVGTSDDSEDFGNADVVIPGISRILAVTIECNKGIGDVWMLNEDASAYDQTTRNGNIGGWVDENIDCRINSIVDNKINYTSHMASGGAEQTHSKLAMTYWVLGEEANASE